MIVEAHNALGETQVFEATRVLVRDGYDNPIAAVIELVGPPQCVVVTRDLLDPDFQEWLRQFGISTTTIVQKVAAPRQSSGITIG